MRIMDFFNKWVKEHPVVNYYFITFLISWGGLTIIADGPGGFSQNHPIEPFLPVYLSTVAGPFIGGLLLIGLYDGMKGYRVFVSRLFKWRVRVRWYLVAILITPITVFSALLLLSLFSPAFQPAIFVDNDNPVAASFGISGAGFIGLFLFVLLLGLFNGFVEEVGWTGFVSPRLNLKRLRIEVGLTLGFIWGLWHFLSNYSGSALEAGSIPLPLYLAVTLFSFLPPFRILMLWVYMHTESLFIAILMHASLDVFWILSMPEVLTGEQRVAWYLVWAAILWVAVAIVNKIEKKNNIGHTN